MYQILILISSYVKNELSSLIDIFFSTFSSFAKNMNLSSNIYISLSFEIKAHFLEGKIEI